MENCTFKRKSGILMPIWALPSKHGIGTLGAEAYKFVDFLYSSSQKIWQLLPMGYQGAANSPYSLFSSFAGNPLFIDLDTLISDGILTKKAVESEFWGNDENKVDYFAVFSGREKVLRLAAKKGTEKYKDEFEKFCIENKSWLEAYSSYMSIRNRFGGECWCNWKDDALKNKSEFAIALYRKENEEEITYYEFSQFLFFRQWNALRAYASEKEIEFIGDVPIYVPLDSADVWSEREFFLLDENGRPEAVSGVPPDAFSSEGQLWGNPLYDWSRMKKDGFGWWIRRIDGAAKLYDTIRIDHFRGFESFWAVPNGEINAVKGEWIKGPGMDLVGVLKNWFYGKNFIAEDLGVITDGVKKLLEDSGFPGMKVLLFAFDIGNKSLYLPHCYDNNCVCYIGTHDNETVSGWLETTPRDVIENARKYMHITEDEGWQYGFIRTGMSSTAKYFIMQIQDILQLPPEFRTNTPGTIVDNWQWRLSKNSIKPSVSKKLKEYTNRYGR